MNLHHKFLGPVGALIYEALKDTSQWMLDDYRLTQKLPRGTGLSLWVCNGMWFLHADVPMRRGEHRIRFDLITKFILWRQVKVTMRAVEREKHLRMQADVIAAITRLE